MAFPPFKVLQKPCCLRAGAGHAQLELQRAKKISIDRKVIFLEEQQHSSLYRLDLGAIRLQLKKH